MFAYKTLLENVKLKFIKTDIKQVLQFLYKLLLFFFITSLLRLKVSKNVD